MKRRREQERDDAIAREQADARREALLAELKARETAVREPEPPAEVAPEPADEQADEPAVEPDGELTPEKGDEPRA
ncbi:MAG TPA: hypothetical protein VFJ00_01685 [Candidatus Limnocylindria bacterium]|nr:hypothetical protein [Candidatus Limnocylindria bacterium]